ncbi:NADH-quinone oxidoreductase subunit N [Chryseolinea sp. H1M3-3]|uniref:NADH-quinone oxidoreductase subunit N n=1 Tax=Chryseolinea sp. H1M3-3 TaxID=3034144 RepID=UPI0023EC4110|nr:NADH-quinone oxidoreductase subunit N [Chryseolinea sp. H1M3-3]
MTGLYDQLESVRASFGFFIPEMILCSAIIILLIAGLIKQDASKLLTVLSFLTFSTSLLTLVLYWPLEDIPVNIFNGMLRADNFSAYLKILIDVGGLLTVLMTWRYQKQQHLSEYYALIVTVVLGAHLLVMSMNFVTVFIALELISISSYILTGFSFSKSGAEGSQKYFLFGSVASAVMLYGFTFLYGMTGSFEFASPVFVNALINNQSTLLLVAGSMALAGFLYKMAAAPLHPWAPDVYEAAPMPVVAFFSVVPKLAGLGILTKFTLALNLFGQSVHDWQFVICLVSMISLTVGNFSALLQKRPKRLMAYSSIAQSGFLLVGVAAFLPGGINFMLFYATVYLLVNFLVFVYLQYFEAAGFETLESFAGVGRQLVWPCVFLLMGFIALTGLPPTAGFTAKLFIFSSTWEAYQLNGKSILLWLLVFGLLNTVISLFYYLKIPFYAFVKKAESNPITNNQTFENFFGLTLVLVILVLFFNPDLLMRWINKINFAL